MLKDMMRRWLGLQKEDEQEKEMKALRDRWAVLMAQDEANQEAIQAALMNLKGITRRAEAILGDLEHLRGMTKRQELDN